jgi:hypothetical protein
MIYADWLEERGDERGEYLRQVVESERIQARLRALRQHIIDPGWLCLVTPCERAMSLVRLNGQLQAFEWLNEGINHVCSYSLEEIPLKGTVDESLATNFEGIWSISGGAQGQQVRRGGWTISKAEITDGWEHVRRLCLEYFFHQEFSPRRPANSTLPDYGVETFVTLLQQWAGGSTVRIFAVDASSTNVFYDMVYNDVLIQAQDRLLLFHLGWSD